MSMKAEFKRQMEHMMAADALSPRMQRILLVAILVFCFTVRLATIGAPALDRTAWKEIDYIMVAQNYANNGFNFLYPEVSWPAEPPRATAMELPLVPFATALLCHLAGFNALTVRMLSLLAFLAMTCYVFLLARRELGPLAGLLAAFASAIIPLYHAFGNLLFSEPVVLALCVAALFYFNEWSYEGKTRDWLRAVGCFSLAVALKLEPLYLLLPYTFLAWRKYGMRFFTEKSYIGFVMGSVAISLLWYTHAFRIAQEYLDVFGIFGGINGGHDKFQTAAMLTDPRWYKTMIGRVGGIGGKFGSILFLVGIAASAVMRNARLFAVYLVAVAIYFVIVAEGNVDAPYRQMNMFPVFSVYASLGAIGSASAASAIYQSRSINRPLHNHRFACTVLAFIMPVFILIPKGQQAFNRNPLIPHDNSRWTLAKELRKHAQLGDKIVTLGEYTIHKGGNDISPVLYYYSGLQGWTLQKADWNIERIADLVDRGAKYLVAFELYREPESEGLLIQLGRQATILYEDKEKKTMIFDLRNLRPGKGA